jgi:putative endonuclease
MAAPWFVYILRCADGSLYTGISNDVARRVDVHNRGLGARYTRGRLPVVLAWSEAVGSRAEASRREIAVKRLSREAKLALASAARPG